MSSVADILCAEGLRLIGELRFDLHLSVWWSPLSRAQLVAIEAGDSLLLKGSKSYYLKSIAEEGETWSRDIGPLHDYLESHFREVHISFDFFRDLPAFVAEREACARTGPATEPEVHRSDPRTEERLRATERMLAFDDGEFSLLSEHLRRRESEQRQTLDRLRALDAQAADRQARLEHLQREYRRKGSAACLTFTIASNLQLVLPGADPAAAIRSILKELADFHRYQVTQTLCGGKLRLQIAESQEPVLAWMEQWFGGALNPSQLDRIKQAVPNAVDALVQHTIVTPDEDIELENTVLDRRKLLGARAFSALLQRLDRTEQHSMGPKHAGPTIRPGRLLAEDGTLTESCELPLQVLGHIQISGRTGSGKSVAGRVLIEEIARHREVAILVLDPRNQSAGLLAAQDQPELLGRFPLFGLDDPRPCPFAYFCPGSPALPPLPHDLGRLAADRSVVSLKGLSDKDRCRLFADCLDAVFERVSSEESHRVRLVVAIEETQLFTRRLVCDAARGEAERAEAALERALREGRKYGLSVLVSTQSVKDFARDAVAIRQNATTKIFFGNSDREIEYVRDYVSDPRELLRLPPGAALFCNPSWGVMRVAIRPSLSKVWDFGESETAVLVGSPRTSRLLSDAAQGLLASIRDHVERTGAPPNVSELGRATGITSRRRLHDLVQELTAAGLVQTRRLREHGQPRVIELVEHAGRGHKSDSNGQEAPQATEESAERASSASTAGVASVLAAGPVRYPNGVPLRTRAAPPTPTSTAAPPCQPPQTNEGQHG